MSIKKIISALKAKYHPLQFPELNKRDPFRILVSCIISQRTKDEVTYPATKRLTKLAKTPKEMIKLSEKQIQDAIYPCGFYKTKAKRIIEASKKIINDHSGNTPNTVEELIKLPGVGRKTANIVITYGFQKPGIAVDTHVHRISNRLGLIKTKTPTESEFALMKVIPKRDWIDYNELLVRHGQNTCKPISPFCSKCSISEYCKRIDIKNSR